MKNICLHLIETINYESRKAVSILKYLLWLELGFVLNFVHKGNKRQENKVLYMLCGISFTLYSNEY